MRQNIACVLIAMALAGCATAEPPVSPSPDPRKALSERYPSARVIHEGELQFEQQTPVERVDLPALAKALPDVRFYTTQLRTVYYEYPHVSVAVAVPKQTPIAVYLSPTYSGSDPEFIEMLRAARVSGPSEERAVADEIASLFANITYKGKIKDAKYQSGRYSADLWHGDLLWRRVLITFANGRVSSVSLTNPRDATTGPD